MKPGDEVVDDETGRRCWLVKLRPRKSIVSTDPKRGAGYYEWTVPTKALRALLPSEIAADRLRERRNALANRLLALRGLVSKADEATLDRIEATLAALGLEP